MPLSLDNCRLIVFDGDSLTNRRSSARQDTWPFLRLMNWDKPWTDHFAEMLFCWRPEWSLSFFNAASAGSTCRGTIDRLEQNVLSRKPDWVILSLAGNDVRLGVPVGEFRETMSTYARRAVEQAGARVLFWGLSEHGPGYPKTDTLSDRRRLYDVLAEIASGSEGVHYEDIGPRVAAKARLLAEQCDLHTIYGDGGHFNAPGNLIIAGEMLRIFGVLRAE